MSGPPEPWLHVQHTADIPIGYVIPGYERGEVLLRGRNRLATVSEWRDLRERIDRFYTDLTDADIHEINRHLEARDQFLASLTTRNLAGYVYLMRARDGRHKIGKSVDPDRRRAQVEQDEGQPVTLLHTVYVSNRHKLETELHRFFATKRREGEWFDLSPEDVRAMMALTTEDAERMILR